MSFLFFFLKRTLTLRVRPNSWYPDLDETSTPLTPGLVLSLSECREPSTTSEPGETRVGGDEGRGDEGSRGNNPDRCTSGVGLVNPWVYGRRNLESSRPRRPRAPRERPRRKRHLLNVSTGDEGGGRGKSVVVLKISIRLSPPYTLGKSRSQRGKHVILEGKVYTTFPVLP